MYKHHFEHVLDILLFATLLLSGALLLLLTAYPMADTSMNVVAGISFSVMLALILFVHLNPDSVRARQSDATLRIAGETLACLKDGLSLQSAQKICRLLLPATGAWAVSITDREYIMGYAGLEATSNPGGSPIRTKATHATLEDGQMRVLWTPEDIGFPSTIKTLRAGILVPLTRGDKIIGVLKFYYRHPREINETQCALAEGLASLLSTQIAAVELEQQTKLATTMELKALQSQINPHFLFNTINTIASLIRTDPERARILLREFAIFYRRTLENSEDLVELTREIEQTMRYFNFEVARFGDDRLVLDVDIEDGLEDLMVPAFIIQPLVENAVKHAMPQEGTMTVSITVTSDGDDAVISVSDDGVGMDESSKSNFLDASASKGLGIAMKNINERLRGYFGTESHMDVTSKPGEGTKVSLILRDALKDD